MTELPNVEPGEWYYAVLCRSCQEPIIVAHDPSGDVKKYPGNDPKLLL